MVLVKNGHIYEGDSFGNLPWNVEFCESDIFQATEAYLLLQVLKLLTFFFFFWPCHMPDLSSPAREQTRAPCTGSVES